MTLKRKIKLLLNKAEKEGLLIGRMFTVVIRKKRELRYARYSKLPIDKKMIVFESYMGRKYADSPKAIYEYMLNDDEYKDYNFVWAFREGVMNDPLELKNNERTRIVKWGSEEYYKTYAEAGFWIANTRIPSSIQRKQGQEYIQCWHGTPLKKLGCDIVSELTESTEARRKAIHDDVRRYTYLVSPSTYFTKVMSSAWNLNSVGSKITILEEGYPRNDGIVNRSEDDAKRIRRSLRITDDKKVILYAPTYREDNRDKGNRYIQDEALDLQKLHDIFGSEYILLHRSHYYIKSEDKASNLENFVVNVSGYPEVNDLYIITDILITDYSSVFFDFGILKKPVIFYMHDLDYYKDRLRGLYLEIDELPGPVAKTQEELEDLLRNADIWSKEDKWGKRYREFSERFTYNEDGHATEKVVRAIFGRKRVV